MIRDAINVGGNPDNIYQLRRSYVREKGNGLCPTLTANMGVGGHNVPFIKDKWGIRRLSIEEVAKLQGFGLASHLFPNIPHNEQYRLLGNAVCVKLAYLVASVCMDSLRRIDP